MRHKLSNIFIPRMIRSRELFLFLQLALCSMEIKYVPYMQDFVIFFVALYEKKKKKQSEAMILIGLTNACYFLGERFVQQKKRRGGFDTTIYPIFIQVTSNRAP